MNRGHDFPPIRVFSHRDKEVETMSLICNLLFFGCVVSCMLLMGAIEMQFKLAPLILISLLGFLIFAILNIIFNYFITRKD